MPRPERPLDPDSGPVQRFAFELRKLRTEAGSPGYRELARRAHYSTTTLAQAARGESLPSLAVTLAYVRACGGDATEWEERWHATAAELGHPSPATPEDDGRAPYVGTAAYGQADAEWFHGRGRLLATLTEWLARQRFVTVVGASGAGKSSLLRAGLVPALSGGHVTTMVLTPGAHPLEECAVRLGARLGVAPGELAADLAERPRNLGLAIRQLLADGPPDAELVLIVDQFEEIFTRCEDESERHRFVAALLAAAESPDSRTRVVVGLRADFAVRLAELGAVFDDSLRKLREWVTVEPMNAEELAEAVTRPAAQAGLIVEKSLVATVVSEAVDRQGALPFVSQVMWETWRRRRGNGLFLAEYRATGGVRGAVTRAADEVYGELDDEQRRIARDVLARLTTLGEHAGGDTPRRVSRAELGTAPRVTRVLDRLVAARLVTLAEDTVEIAHDALLTWPTLRKWLAANRKALRAHRRLTEAATEWERQGRDEGHLYRGSVLDAWQAEAPDTLNETESAFLAASAAVQRRDRSARRRRMGLTVAGLGVIGVVLSVLTYLLVVVRPDMPAEERDLAYSRQLAAAARSQLPVDPELAMLLAIEATKVRRTPESDAVLRQAVVDSRVVASLPTGVGRALGVAYSPNGVSRIAVTGDDGTVRLWDEPAHGEPWGKPMVLRGHTGEVWSPVFSPDGRYLATAGADATVRLWDLSSGDEVAELRGHTGLILNLAFSGDGTRLASTGEDAVVVWDVAGQRELARFEGQAFGVAFSPDSRYLAYSTPHGVVWLLDLAGERQPVPFPGPPSWQGRVVFSPDGRRLVSSSDDGMLRIWDTAGVAPPVTLRGHDGRVLALAFGPDGRTLATTGQDGTVRLLTTEKDVNPMVLRGHRGEVLGVAFNPDGRRLASVGIDGMLRVWRVSAPGDGIVMRGHTGPVLSADFTPDGSRAVSASQDGTVRVWSLPGGEPGAVLSHGAVLDVDVGPDGRQAASVSSDGVLRVWDLETGELVREETGAEWSVEFTSDGRQVVTGCADGSVCRMPGGSLTGYQGGIRQVAVNGSLVAGSGDDGTVLVWRAGSGPVVLQGHSGPVYSVAIDPLGRKVASGGHDGTVRIWPVGGGEPLELRGHQGVVLSVGFSPDGQLLASSGNDRTLRVWSTTAEGDPVVFSGYQASVESVSFSADGRSLLTTHDDGTVRVQACEVCGSTQQVLALGRARVTRQLTADERKTFGVRS